MRLWSQMLCCVARLLQRVLCKICVNPAIRSSAGVLHTTVHRSSDRMLHRGAVPVYSEHHTRLARELGPISVVPATRLKPKYCHAAATTDDQRGTAVHSCNNTSLKYGALDTCNALPHGHRDPVCKHAMKCWSVLIDAVEKSPCALLHMQSDEGGAVGRAEGEGV